LSFANLKVAPEYLHELLSVSVGCLISGIRPWHVRVGFGGISFDLECLDGGSPDLFELLVG
jgi:hypothetical protein